jgi:hypothetical protein
MDWIGSLFSSSGVSFSSGAVATKMAEGSERRVRLLRYNNLKGKSGNKSLTLLLLLNDSTYASLNRRVDSKMKDRTIKTQEAKYQRTKA